MMFFWQDGAKLWPNFYLHDLELPRISLKHLQVRFCWQKSQSVVSLQRRCECRHSLVLCVGREARWTLPQAPALVLVDLSRCVLASWTTRCPNDLPLHEDVFTSGESTILFYEHSWALDCLLTQWPVFRVVCEDTDMSSCWLPEVTAPS